MVNKKEINNLASTFTYAINKRKTDSSYSWRGFKGVEGGEGLYYNKTLPTLQLCM